MQRSGATDVGSRGRYETDALLRDQIKQIWDELDRGETAPEAVVDELAKRFGGFSKSTTRLALGSVFYLEQTSSTDPRVVAVGAELWKVPLKTRREMAARFVLARFV